MANNDWVPVPENVRSATGAGEKNKMSDFGQKILKTQEVAVRWILAIAFFSATARADEVLPAPPDDATALARAEYHRAEQEYAAGNYDAAEAALERSWRHQKIPAIQYNLALAHIKQGRLDQAASDMIAYFAWAAPAAQDPANKQARALLRKIAKLQGHEGRSGRKYARECIAKMRAGDYGCTYQIDRALDETQDLALLYWIVLGEYRATKARYAYKASLAYLPAEQKRMSSEGLDNYRRLLGAYFNGATDLADIKDAQQLYEEIDADWRRALVLERLARQGRSL
jgi:hypothetical protein